MYQNPIKINKIKSAKSNKTQNFMEIKFVGWKKRATHHRNSYKYYVFTEEIYKKNMHASKFGSKSKEAIRKAKGIQILGLLELFSTFYIIII